MSEDNPTMGDRLKSKFQHWGIIAVALAIAFLIGIVPMWLNSRSAAAERDAALTKLRRSEIGSLLTSSIVDARRGEYETARQEASNFFTRLRAEDEMGETGFLTSDSRAKLSQVFTERDAVITMLAQRDPAAPDRLTAIYLTYQQAAPAPVATPD